MSRCIAKVIIPPQEIKGGIVEIKIIVGRFEGCNVIGKKTRFNKSVATRILNFAQNDPHAIKINRLERGMLLINDLPGVQATSAMRPGKTKDGVVVDLDIKDTPLIRGDLGYDDYGIRASGAQRGTVNLRLDDPFFCGDQINGGFIYTGLMHYESFAYLRPIGSSGLRGGLSTDYLHYRLGKEFNYLGASGSSFTIGPNLVYPLIRSRTKNVHILANFRTKRFLNYVTAVATEGQGAGSDKKLYVGNVFVDGSMYDQFLGGGFTRGGLGFILGNLNLKGNTANYDADQSTYKTNGMYSKLNFLVSRSQRIADKTLLDLTASGQIAFHNLDSSEQFDLGGPDRVRAYAAGDANGDHGVVATAELSRELWNNFRIAGFYDFGYIVQHYHTYSGWQSAVNAGNGYMLGAIGVGLNWKPTKWFAAKVSAATATQHNPIGYEPAQFNAGIGQSSKVWFQANLLL